MNEKRLIHEVETRSYLYDTSSFNYKNLNKVAAGWRQIACVRVIGALRYIKAIAGRI